jgi:hypothetical protein
MTPEEIEQSILTIGTAILTMEATLSELSATVNILLNQVANDMRPDDPMGALKILHTRQKKALESDPHAQEIKTAREVLQELKKHGGGAIAKS